MGMLVLSSEAKELCLESWALAASALFHSALISMEARYSVCVRVWRRGGQRGALLGKSSKKGAGGGGPESGLPSFHLKAFDVKP